MSAKHAKPAVCLAVAAVAAALASGCSGKVEIGSNTVSASDIESEANAALTKKVGQAPASIDCPNDLDAKAGQSEACTLTAKDGTTYPMTATITSVSGDNTAHFHFSVGNANK